MQLYEPAFVRLIGAIDARVACFCFHSAIFQLTSAKFRFLLMTRERFGLATRNFDRNLRLMSSTFIPNFETISHMTLVLGPKNCPKNLAKKAVSLNNGLSTAKNISHDYMSFKIPFHPNQPTFGRDEIFFFFFLNLERSSSKPQNIEV